MNKAAWNVRGTCGNGIKQHIHRREVQWTWVLRHNFGIDQI